MFTYVIDQHCEEFDNPRDGYGTGIIATWHRRYNLGDEQPTQAPDAWLSDLLKREPRAIVLPVYLYDHGGITISTAPFSCPWDSGQIGYIYTTPDRVQEIYAAWKNLTAPRIQELTRRLNHEIEIYDQYLRGDLYRYTVLDENGEHHDQGQGYYDAAECELAAIREISILNRKAA
jgi:hypothetical protein